MLCVGDDPGLRTRVAGGTAPPSDQRDPQQGHRDPLAGGQEHVELARVGNVGDAERDRRQLVGGVAHRRDDDDHVVAGPTRSHDAVGDGLDPLDGSDGRAAELHHDGAGVRLALVGRNLRDRLICSLRHR